MNKQHLQEPFLGSCFYNISSGITLVFFTANNAYSLWKIEAWI